MTTSPPALPDESTQQQWAKDSAKFGHGKSPTITSITAVELPEGRNERTVTSGVVRNCTELEYHKENDRLFQ